MKLMEKENLKTLKFINGSNSSRFFLPEIYKVTAKCISYFRLHLSVQAKVLFPENLAQNYGGPQLSRQNTIHHGKIKLVTAKNNNEFITAKYNSKQQIQVG